MRLISHERLRSVIAYDPASGDFTWLISTSNRTAAGSLAGHKATTGYLTIRLDGTLYQAHRLAWFYVHGNWPDGEIDHMNGARLDNRIANLRDVPKAQNRQNLRNARVTSKSGLLGVREKNGKWLARIVVDRREIHLGSFSSPEEASAAYLAAKREMHAGCTL